MWRPKRALVLADDVMVPPTSLITRPHLEHYVHSPGDHQSLCFVSSEKLQNPSPAFWLCCHCFIWVLATPVCWDLNALLHSCHWKRSFLNCTSFSTRVLNNPSPSTGFNIERKPHNAAHHCLSLIYVCLSTDDFFFIFIFDEVSDYLS